MKTKRLNSDRISTLPEDVSGKILSLMPIKDALRTGVLSKKWRYTWRSMPKLVFTADMVKAGANSDSGELKKYKVVNAILHVVALHTCPLIVEFGSSVIELDIYSEFTQITSCLARCDQVEELKFSNPDSLSLRKLPVSFFSLQGLKCLRLENCTFEPPVTIGTFSRLKSVKFVNVNLSFQMLQRFLSKCPLLDFICLAGGKECIDFEAGGSKFTFLDCLQCVPLIQVLDFTMDNCFFACPIPHKLPTPLAHLERLSISVNLMDLNSMSFALCILRSSPMLEESIIQMHDNDPELPLVRQTPINFLDPKDYLDLKLDHLEHLTLIVNLMDRNVMSFALCIIRSSPMLEEIIIQIYDNDQLPVDRQTPTNFLDPEDYSDLKLDHLETLKIEQFTNLPIEMDFVKLIMAKSPELEDVSIELYKTVSVDEELKMLRNLLRCPRASPSAKLIIERPKTSV